MGMDVQEALESRRTIHNYRPEKVEEEILERALRAAIRAPNHKLTNPWRFTRVGPEVRAELVEKSVAMKLARKEPQAGLEAKLRAKFSNPAELFVVSQVISADEFRRREDYASVACAIQNFSVSLWAEGIGSKWSTGDVTRASETYELLELDADQEEIVGFVWVGHPEEIPDPPRKPLSEVVRQTA